MFNQSDTHLMLKLPILTHYDGRAEMASVGHDLHYVPYDTLTQAARTPFTRRPYAKSDPFCLVTFESQYPPRIVGGTLFSSLQRHGGSLPYLYLCGRDNSEPRFYDRPFI